MSWVGPPGVKGPPGLPCRDCTNGDDDHQCQECMDVFRQDFFFPHFADKQGAIVFWDERKSGVSGVRGISADTVIIDDFSVWQAYRRAVSGGKGIVLTGVPPTNQEKCGSCAASGIMADYPDGGEAWNMCVKCLSGLRDNWTPDGVLLVWSEERAR